MSTPLWGIHAGSAAAWRRRRERPRQSCRPLQGQGRGTGASAAAAWTASGTAAPVLGDGAPRLEPGARGRRRGGGQRRGLGIGRAASEIWGGGVATEIWGAR